jgi:predicted dehydrogenase
MNTVPKIWLIGTSVMAMDYAKVLKALGKDFLVIGRGEQKAKQFEEQIGMKPMTGGIEHAIQKLGYIPEQAVNCVGMEQLTPVNKVLLGAGVKKILIEKPAVATPDEINDLVQLSEKNSSACMVAYNRRFYSSVLAAQKMIQEDGGVSSFNFEFTEWSHVIEKIEKPKVVFENWFLANSTHVIDLAYFLGGFPDDLSAYQDGKDKLSWHRAASSFSGSGRSSQGALFAYYANWCAPGRFSVEVLTAKKKYIFRPLEKLQIQKTGSVAIEFAEGIDYSLDEQFKPGLYQQTKAFLEEDYSRFCTLKDQAKHMKWYKLMRGF